MARVVTASARAGQDQPVQHDPVLVERIVELLALPDAPDPSVPEQAVIIDATVGAGGHAAALLAASHDDVVLVGFDRDPDALELAARRLAAYAHRVRLVHAPYDELGDHLDEIAAGPVRAVLYDLGVSSMQLDRGERGFSFRSDAPLDMRMDRGAGGPTADDLVNGLEPQELARIIRVYGEDRLARRIAHAIVRARPVHTTRQLAQVISDAVPAAARAGHAHPATRTFQALRIVVNDELDRLRASLPQALGRLTPAPSGEHAGRGGRIAVLSYHSLEDRITKQALTEAARGCVCPPDLPICACGREPAVRVLTRGAERPAESEKQRNPRARSARLRAAERTPSAPPT